MGTDLADKSLDNGDRGFRRAAPAGKSSRCAGTLRAGKIDSHGCDPVDADIGAEKEAAIAFDLDQDSGATDPALAVLLVIRSV